MSEFVRTLPVPNVLNGDCPSVDQFYSIIAAAPLATHYKLDLGRVSFVVPYGVIALCNGARLLHQRSQNGVEFVNIQPGVHSYLERVDFFADVFGPSFCKHDPETICARSSNSLTVLELMPLHSDEALDAITRRASTIFMAHMGKAASALVVMVLSELCTNVLLHSGDTSGTVLIQKCLSPSNPALTCVRVAVSDLGYGIRATLSRKHAHLNQTPKAIKAAFDGFSSRESGRSALGLRSVAQLAIERGGHIWIRSENAALLHSFHSPRQFSRVCHVPGTQVAVEFRIPTDDETYLI